MFRRILLPQKVETGGGSGEGSGSGSGSNLVWDLWADEWKIYPFSVLPWSVCENWEKEGKYKSYGTDRLIDVLMYCKRLMARPDINASSLRIVRLIRDIPVPYIIAGNKVAHLRDVIKEKLHQKGEYCVCIRCREIRMERPQLSSARWRMIVKRVKTGGDRGWDSLDKDRGDSPMDPLIHLQPNTFPSTTMIKSSILVLWGVIYGFLWSLADIFWTIIYPYHQGQWWWGQTLKINPKGHNNYIQDLPLSWQKIPENYHSLQQSGNAYNCFLSLEGGRHQHDTPIYGFIRFHLTPNAGRRVFSALQGCILVRELHVYGKSTGVVSWETKNKESNPHSQHRGIGSTLLSMAEYHSRKQGFRGVAIISGVGVRDYYRKRGYSLIDHYMIKYF